MMKKKLYKRIAALGIVGAMTVAMAMPAMAATRDSSVSVTGITAGDSAAFYQVIAPDTTSTTGWKLADGFTSLTLSNLLDGTIDAKDAAAIVAAAKNATAKSTQTTEYSYTTDADEKAGLYVVIITPASSNTTTLYNPVFVSADYDSTNSTNTIDINSATGTYNNGGAKKQTPTVTKSITDSTQKDVNIGDTVSFKVETTIPAMSTYTKPVFEISDAVSIGLEIDTSSISVSGPTDTAYTITQSTSGYTLKFTETYLKSLTSPQTVTITYSAKVTSAATYNVNVMTNTASIKFSNSPTDEKGNGSDDDKTYHYTFSLDASILGETSKYNEELIKTAVDKDGNAITSYNKTYNGTERAALSGATFALYKDSACTNEYKQKDASGTETAVTATSDGNGDISFKGLDAGTYFMKETSAPAGFVCATTVYTIKITPHYDSETSKILQSYDVEVSGEGVDTSKATYTLSNQGTTTVKSSEASGTTKSANIKNVQAAALPSTGGMGTTIFYILGAVIVIGAGVVLVARRRANAQ